MTWYGSSWMFCMNTRFHTSTKRSSSTAGAAVRAELGALVEEDLRRGPARSRHAHLPEVVLVEALHAIGGHADVVDPDLGGLVVGDVHRVPEALGVEPESLRDELVGPRNRLLLEVVAEGEVAEHLEEGEMSGRGAHDVDVDRACHLLDRRRSGIRRFLLPEQVRLERHHPRIGEQQRGVDRNQRRRWHDGVAAIGKEVEIGLRIWLESMKRRRLVRPGIHSLGLARCAGTLHPAARGVHHAGDRRHARHERGSRRSDAPVRASPSHRGTPRRRSSLQSRRGTISIV